MIDTESDMDIGQDERNSSSNKLSEIKALETMKTATSNIGLQTVEKTNNEINSAAIVPKELTEEEKNRIEKADAV